MRMNDIHATTWRSKNGRETHRRKPYSRDAQVPLGLTSMQSDPIKVYDYSHMSRVYPWAKAFRAGIILLYECDAERNPCDPSITLPKFEMLMVWQKAEDQRLRDGTTRHLPMRIGFPKGQSEDTDKSALTTALRELKEETGIEILRNKGSHAHLVVPAIIILREGGGIDEVLIYFIMIIKGARPRVTICADELSGFAWIDVSAGLRGLSPTTRPTAELLKLIENIDFWGPMTTIKP